MTNATELCFGSHAAGDPAYARYHDTEWGRPVHGETALFERLCLEGFQVGLSWRTVLGKRDAFREAFAGFDPARVAAFGAADVDRLMGDSRLIRNQAKIWACVRGAAIVEAMHVAGETLDALIWSAQPAHHPRPQLAGRATQSPGSAALARELHRRGFRFVGPVNVYATLQACGVINDHIVGCAAGDEIAAAARG
ncbi:MAG: DNA-3-methyladenine glycosylase I [Propionibacteriaceae bacterium]|jgi:DNA-3-methyladenine glycosylase I|nr:DNA-3-methyladenine glycosylase I [Propionibacteriaceae bacterium]